THPSKGRFAREWAPPNKPTLVLATGSMIAHSIEISIQRSVDYLLPAVCDTGASFVSERNQFIGLRSARSLRSRFSESKWIPRSLRSFALAEVRLIGWRYGPAIGTQ